MGTGSMGDWVAWAPVRELALRATVEMLVDSRGCYIV